MTFAIVIATLAALVALRLHLGIKTAREFDAMTQEERMRYVSNLRLL